MQLGGGGGWRVMARSSKLTCVTLRAGFEAAHQCASSSSSSVGSLLARGKPDHVHTYSVSSFHRTSLALQIEGNAVTMNNFEYTWACIKGNILLREAWFLLHCDGSSSIKPLLPAVGYF